MSIDWTHFTPWTSLSGGLLIGVAASLLLFVNGRIAGISGILGGLLRWRAGDRAWRLSFIIGLIAAPLTYRLLATPAIPSIDAGWPTLIGAGLLVGLGTRYASGCTSGHGICGLARHSPRSLIATLTFMLAGFATVYLLRHVWA